MPQDFMAWEKAFQAISHQEHHPVAPRSSHPQAPQSPVLPRGTAQADTVCLFLSHCFDLSSPSEQLLPVEPNFLF